MFEAHLVPSLFLDGPSIAASTSPGARPQGETSHGPATASVFGGSTLGEQRDSLCPPPYSGKEGAEKWTLILAHHPPQALSGHAPAAVNS